MLENIFFSFYFIIFFLSLLTWFSDIQICRSLWNGRCRLYGLGFSAHVEISFNWAYFFNEFFATFYMCWPKVLLYDICHSILFLFVLFLSLIYICNVLFFTCSFTNFIASNRTNFGFRFFGGKVLLIYCNFVIILRFESLIHICLCWCVSALSTQCQGRVD